MMTLKPTLPHLLVEEQVRAALLEDLGRRGDITTAATIPAHAQAEAVLVSHGPGTIAGIEVARTAFRLMDPDMAFEVLIEDGQVVTADTVLARLTGAAGAMLSAERVALNMLMHLSGVATATAQFAAEIAHTHARICCTRKTFPGLRLLQKYAVKVGGGSNHRFGLDDALLIKDNHIAVVGGVAAAIHAARAAAGHMVMLEVEADTLEQVREAVECAPDVILLDNMRLDMLRQAVALVNGRCRLEASGNVDLTTVRAIAETGVDYISTSRITMAAMPLDMGLDIAIG
ncbi:carboxylating nicotinate-nucleotide diphosphorylase [Rhizobium sp. CFBP 8762]|uniref:carboxylating nicotinate-nucleotide diphosphorylase n=1 Tax=Rhizobium sp. CFBP 8762 TaxID=2775279 RepID=UPI0017855F0C|nr:carboxylating nicotinate-nucleotide diphosphorylase [Rhizobium sp. CFBP 8762]